VTLPLTIYAEVVTFEAVWQGNRIASYKIMSVPTKKYDTKDVLIMFSSLYL